MGRKPVAVALALLIPLSGMVRLSGSYLNDENGKPWIGNIEACPLSPSMTRIAAEGELCRLAPNTGKFQFIDSRVLRLALRSLALGSSSAHSWPIPLALSPQALCVKLQV
jgi:hypothetical protein